MKYNQNVIIKTKQTIVNFEKNFQRKLHVNFFVSVTSNSLLAASFCIHKIFQSKLRPRQNSWIIFRSCFSWISCNMLLISRLFGLQIPSIHSQMVPSWSVLWLSGIVFDLPWQNEIYQYSNNIHDGKLVWRHSHSQWQHLHSSLCNHKLPILHSRFLISIAKKSALLNKRASSF